jgi:antitoxin component of MazEF toxin-antitoxin module
VRGLQKLVRNGNSTSVSIPKPILVHLGWLPGEAVVIELLEDQSLRIRRPVERDFAPLGAPRMVFDMPAAVKP